MLTQENQESPRVKELHASPTVISSCCSLSRLANKSNSFNSWNDSAWKLRSYTKQREMGLIKPQKQVQKSVNAVGYISEHHGSCYKLFLMGPSVYKAPKCKKIQPQLVRGFFRFIMYMSNLIKKRCICYVKQLFILALALNTFRLIQSY